MFKFILCAILTSLLFLGIALDSFQWAAPYTAPTPHASHAELADNDHFANESQHIYQFSGTAEGVRLEDGRIVLNDHVAGDDSERFDGGLLTVDASDITSYSYEYNVTVEGDMVLTLTAGTIGDNNATFGIIDAPMGTEYAKTNLYKDRGITTEALIDTLTFVLTLTHADGSESVHILPLVVEKIDGPSHAYSLNHYSR